MSRVFLFLLIALCAGAGAQERAGDKLVIGQSVELSGQAVSKENLQGALAYFQIVNSQGGVHGRPIELKSYDDKRDPAVTRQNTIRLLEQDRAIALFGYRSTPTVEAVLPLLQQQKVALVAPFSGAQSLHQPFNPYVFHLRASYQDEAERMVATLASLQSTRVAVLYQDDPFGRDGLAGFERSMRALQLAPLAVASYSRKDLKVDRAAAEIAAVNPQAVLMACTPSACADFIRQIRGRGLQPQFAMLSNVNSDEFLKSLGDYGRGVGVMQVMPFPRDLAATVTREFQHALKTMPNPPPSSYAALEGFVAAKLMTEGLRRAGPHPTRQKLVAALEAMREFDLGGVTVNYSPGSHQGSKFVEMVVVGKNGVLWR